MKQIGLRRLAIATSTLAIATMFSAGWSVDTAQARRLYVSPHHYYNPYSPAITDVAWDAVRVYYLGGPWSGVVSGWPYHWNGWSDYAAQNGIGCTPGTLVKGGDGIMYVCQ
jgi:hypothetical protein